MFASVWNFVKRHRKKLIFTGVLVGGAWAAGKYATKKFIDFQEKEAEEYLSQARRQHHFDSNQRTCNMTVLSMLPSLREALKAALDSEALTEQLKLKPADKLAIWNELKIISFCRSIASVYSLSMLIAMLRVQLNIIGGYMFLDTLASKNPESSTVTTPRVQENYLASVQYILNKGLLDMVVVTQAEVEKVVGGLSLKQQVSLTDLQEIISAVRKRVEYRQQNGYHDAGASSLVKFMLPDEQTTVTDEMSVEDQFLANLQVETRDMLESGDFHSVLTTILDSGFIRLVDVFAEYYKPTVQQNGVLASPNDLRMPLAKVIPITSGLLYFICADAPNAFVQELLLKEQVKDFAANIYEAFSQPNTRNHGNTMD